jgi:hypothetical protein
MEFTLPRPDDSRKEMIVKVKEMRDEKMTFREIAAELSISRSTAQRLYAAWRPEFVEKEEPEDPNEVIDDYFFGTCTRAQSKVWHDYWHAEGQYHTLIKLGCKNAAVHPGPEPPDYPGVRPDLWDEKGEEEEEEEQEQTGSAPPGSSPPRGAEDPDDDFDEEQEAKERYGIDFDGDTS